MAMESCPNCGRLLEGPRGPACPNCGAFLPRPAEETQPPPSAAPPAASPEMPGALHEAPPLPRTRRPGFAFLPPPPEGGRLLTGSAAGDAFVGFFLVLLFNFGLPTGVSLAIAEAVPILGSGVTVYLLMVAAYFPLRGRYPALARGWRAALLFILTLGALLVLAFVLLLLGVIAVCSRMGRG